MGLDGCNSYWVCLWKRREYKRFLFERNSRKLYEWAEQTINTFDKLYRKCLPSKVTDETFETLSYTFTNYLNENKNDSFLHQNLGKENKGFQSQSSVTEHSNLKTVGIFTSEKFSITMFGKFSRRFQQGKEFFVLLNLIELF